LAEQSKYDFFMEELVALEKQVYIFINKEEEIFEERSLLLKELQSLKDENEILKIKLNEAERKAENSNNNLFENTSELNDETKEKIKTKIDELINKIDNHLRS